MSANEEFSCCKSLGCKIGLTLKAMLKKMSNQFEEHEIDLTMEQYFILNILDSNEDLILRDIADMLERDKSAVVRHINALEKKHFVTRATCEQDKRKKLLFLTKPGVETLKNAQTVCKKTEEKITEQISGEQLDSFENVLVEIINKAQNEPFVDNINKTK